MKSIPRHFDMHALPRRFVVQECSYRIAEHSSFRDDLLYPYSSYMQANPGSLLVRITDFLQYTHHSLGSFMGTAPSHHIVMENIMYGQDTAKDEGDERDVAGGALNSEATKNKLADIFEEGIVLTLDHAEDLKLQLEKDTKLLADCNAVDYSFFLLCIRLTSPSAPSSPNQHGPSWWTGVPSADGKHAYRAALLEFFWAKHKVHAKAMTGLISAYNAIDAKGPMSVTTSAPEYRTRFLEMCRDIVEVRDGLDENAGERLRAVCMD